ncbi:efflux transporter periplasmic adaptor subunit (plasmid) [Sulfitobacter alexandrii]|uniref:Efflux transporter periplasmic adaptor subunit n=1 Tax=Sulfitobacter alexandrii TaxID=1917485 RepID=A0A1J0WNT3_9RHOB|nr:efflux RND transporter periplasmic adaptor subunit [Sulfitobacter alexandrii]APE45949.1 efflux transporter periplasmic adaptor subunit [Sulfitobacter alexandrii]
MDKTPETAERPRPLDFKTDRGASRSVWIAAAILAALVLWMGSGFILPSETEAPQQQVADKELASVLVRTSQAEQVTLTFQAEGQAQPDRDTALRAEATGDIVEVLADKGENVEAGQLIARLSSTRAEADLSRAAEERARAQREIDNAEQLLERGVGTADRVAEARAALASAEAQVIAAEQALEDLNILAPFPGRIETLTLDVGEFVSAGEEVGRIVDNQPLTVAIQVPQQSLRQIQNGQPAEVTFITGETRQGEVTFVGTSAAAETRTFLAEIEVANEDGAIPAGVSAEILIPTGQTMAHFVSPSIVSLNADGEIGVKTVEDGTVRFYPIQIVKAELQGVWATGLPDTAQIITIGQGFVQAGEQVRAQTSDTENGDVTSAARAPQDGASEDRE